MQQAAGGDDLLEHSFNSEAEQTNATVLEEMFFV